MQKTNPKVQRRAVRLKRRMSARIQSQGGGSDISAIAAHFSRIGLFLQTRAPLPLGTQLHFNVTMPAGETLSLSGKVVSTQRAKPFAARPVQPGVGIELSHPPNPYLEFLAQNSA